MILYLVLHYAINNNEKCQHERMDGEVVAGLGPIVYVTKTVVKHHAIQV